MEWDGTWDTTRLATEKQSIVSSRFWGTFPGYPALTIQPFARDKEEDYPFAEAVVRACELLDAGRSFTVWLTSNPQIRLVFELRNEGGAGVPAKVKPAPPTPLRERNRFESTNRL